MEEHLKELITLRRRHGWVLVLVGSFQVLIFGWVMKATWGVPEATFLNVLFVFYALYALMDGVRIYRNIRNEEDRIRREIERAKQVR